MSDAAGLWVLVPLKRLDRGKERLAPALDAAARRALIRAMAHDVIAALRALPLPAGRVQVVADDAEVAELARAAGATVFVPPPATADPLNADLAAAAAAAGAAGAEHLLFIHADLPCVDALALRALVAGHIDAVATHGAVVTLCTDRAGTGTNCLLCTPPGAIALAFGRDSRARHRAACAENHVLFREDGLPALAFDLDEPEDLRALVRLAQTSDNAIGRHTRAALAVLGAHDG